MDILCTELKDYRAKLQAILKVKFLIPSFLAIVLLSLPCRADDTAIAGNSALWPGYVNPRYGYSLKFPPNWFYYDNMDTGFRANGLKSVSNVCLNPRPVKNEPCQINVYVIPEKDFTPPSDGKFYGLREIIQPMKEGEVWQVFYVIQGEDPENRLVNDYQVKNHFVYLWSQSGDPPSEMFQAFHIGDPETPIPRKKIY